MLCCRRYKYLGWSPCEELEDKTILFFNYCFVPNSCWCLLPGVAEVSFLFRWAEPAVVFLTKATYFDLNTLRHNWQTQVLTVVSFL